MALFDWVSRFLAQSNMDFKVSKWILQHQNDYDKFIDRLWLIKNGDAKVYYEMYNIYLKNLPEGTRTRALHIFQALTHRFQDGKMLNKTINEEITDDLKVLYGAFVQGETLYWDIKNDKVGILNNSVRIKKNNSILLSKDKVAQWYDALPMELHVYLKNQIKSFVGFVNIKAIIVNATFNFHLINNNNALTFNKVWGFLNTTCCYLLIILFHGLPETLANMRQMTDDSDIGLAFCMYYFIKNDHGLMRMSKFLGSTFYNDDCRNDTILLVRNIIVSMAKYEKKKGFSKDKDWENILSELPDPQSRELTEAIFGVMRSIKQKRGRKERNISLLEIFNCQQNEEVQTLMNAVGIYLKMHKDGRSIGILFFILGEQNFVQFKDKGENDDTKVEFSVLLRAFRDAFNINAAKSTIKDNFDNIQFTLKDFEKNKKVNKPLLAAYKRCQSDWNDSLKEAIAGYKR